jgi:hypothetical protein
MTRQLSACAICACLAWAHAWLMLCPRIAQAEQCYTSRRLAITTLELAATSLHEAERTALVWYQAAQPTGWRCVRYSQWDGRP